MCYTFTTWRVSGVNRSVVGTRSGDIACSYRVSSGSRAMMVDVARSARLNIRHVTDGHESDQLLHLFRHRRRIYWINLGLFASKYYRQLVSHATQKCLTAAGRGGLPRPGLMDRETIRKPRNFSGEEKT